MYKDSSIVKNADVEVRVSIGETTMSNTNGLKTNAIEIRFEPYRNRSAAYDGPREIGKCCFTRSDAFWVIEHTETDPLYAGQGIAGKLVKAVLDAAREQGMKIRPLCSYADAYMTKHTEYADLKK